MSKVDRSAVLDAKELFAAERDNSLRAQIAAAKAATLAKMEKLRALRLVRDAEQDLRN